MTVLDEPIATSSLLDCEAEIMAIASTMAVSRARLLHLVGEYDAAGGWITSGAISCAHWLADLLDVELSTAREQVRTARALRVLPATKACLDDGSLSYAKARQLTRIATPDNEHELLAIAERCPAGALARALADWHQRNDPDGAAARCHDDRGLTVRTAPTGNRVITIELEAHDAALIETAIDLEVMRTPAGATEPHATLRQQRADAFLRLANTRTDAPAGASSRVRPELILHRRIGETTLTDGTPLPPNVARRLTCDTDRRIMTHWPDGSPADIGRKHPHITPRLRRLVHERAHNTCEHPTCTAQHFLDVHHITHWKTAAQPILPTSGSSAATTTEPATPATASTILVTEHNETEEPRSVRGALNRRTQRP